MLRQIRPIEKGRNWQKRKMESLEWENGESQSWRDWKRKNQAGNSS